VHQVVEKNIAVAGFVGNTAVNVAVTGGEAALDFLSSIDAEKVPTVRIGPVALKNL
jgi:hypothetical protein